MPSRSSRRTNLRRWAIASISILIASATLACAAVSFVSWWIDCTEKPVPADVLVVLSGDYARTLHAADLYAQSYAPVLWISQPPPGRNEELLKQIRIDYPSEPVLNRRILLRKGVPEKAIRFYGQGVYSTRDEAMALQRELTSKDRKILVVTSGFHARRARMILRRYLPDKEIHVVSTPYGRVDQKWWQDKELAQASIMEIFRFVYYLAGGSMSWKPLIGDTHPISPK